MLSDIYAKVIGFIVLVIGLVAAYFGIKHKGKTEKEVEIKAASADVVIENASVAKEVEREVDKMDEDTVDKRLSKWMRDDR